MDAARWSRLVGPELAATLVRPRPHASRCRTGVQGDPPGRRRTQPGLVRCGPGRTDPCSSTAPMISSSVTCRPIVTGQLAWCQLFSEPNAGSDLAGLQTRAERDGDEWVVNGQKVWTSAGQIADWAMLLARTDIDVPKHAGISYFLIDMRQPGIEVRPLREMTGRAFFNEVFITDARVSHADLIGGEGNGWQVANTTLAYERSGAAGGGVASKGRPGTVAGDLDRPAGEFVAGPGPDR